MTAQIKLRYYLLVYSALMIWFSFYWGNNWQEYCRYKGDYFEYSLDFVFL